jgi:hypothetical protein
VAEVITEPVQWSTRSINARQEHRHNWDQWADGRVWKIRQGEDYVALTQSMKARIYRYGRRHGLRVRIVADTKTQPENITFQFIR